MDLFGTEHEPTPWIYLPSEKADPRNGVRVQSVGMIGRALGDGSYTIIHGTPDCILPLEKANARFIVRAVNAHDCLLAACKTALRIVRNIDAGHVVVKGDDYSLGDTLRDAIAKAEAKPCE